MTPPPPGSLSGPHHPETAETNLKRVGEELENERRRLQGGGNALTELRSIVEDLQKQIANGAGEGSGLILTGL
jgi:hypothetical protein